MTKSAVDKQTFALQHYETISGSFAQLHATLAVMNESFAARLPLEVEELADLIAYLYHDGPTERSIESPTLEAVPSSRR